jgi:hypothetical protein
MKGGAGNSDRAISGGLAQPKPCRARPTEEQAHEKDEKCVSDARKRIRYIRCVLQPEKTAHGTERQHFIGVYFTTFTALPRTV